MKTAVFDFDGITHVEFLWGIAERGVVANPGSRLVVFKLDPMLGYVLLCISRLDL